MIVWTHSQGVFPLRNELVKALKLPAKDIRCIHVEGSGCYGQNGADDVALDAALLARAVPDKPVRLQWMRDDEFAWEPYGAAMSMSVKASLNAEGQIADWQYELWSNTHSMRPESTDGTNVLAAWYLAEPQPHGAAAGLPQPAGGGDRNAVPLYEFPTRRSCIISFRRCRSGFWRCARSAPMPTCSRSNVSWMRWRRWPRPIRSRSGWRI